MCLFWRRAERDDLVFCGELAVESLKALCIFGVVGVADEVEERRTDGVLAVGFNLLVWPGMLWVKGKQGVRGGEDAGVAGLERLVEIDAEGLRDSGERGECMQVERGIRE